MRLLRIFGVDIRLNIFFMLLFIIYWYFGVFDQALVIFCVVFLHEMGHVVVAVGYGIKVREVELLPFGGVAKVEDSIELDPVIETYMALGGPLTNGFLALAGWILNMYGMGNQRWLPFFIQCNLMLGIFNLLPALPLDGGRIFRAFKALRVGLKKATEQSVALSKWVGLVMAGLGIWSLGTGGGKYLNLLVLAVFLVYSAAKEKGSAMYIFMKFLARKKEELFREGVLLARQVVALESSHIKDVVKYFVPRKYHLVVIVGRDQRVKGTLTEGEIIEEMLEGGLETPVGMLVQRKK
ncbi:MAG: M50 family metallopeptidase [Eubacteriales bacterium]